jgi:hypothetical protein
MKAVANECIRPHVDAFSGDADKEPIRLISISDKNISDTFLSYFFIYNYNAGVVKG